MSGEWEPVTHSGVGGRPGLAAVLCRARGACFTAHRSHAAAGLLGSGSGSPGLRPHAAALSLVTASGQLLFAQQTSLAPAPGCVGAAAVDPGGSRAEPPRALLWAQVLGASSGQAGGRSSPEGPFCAGVTISMASTPPGKDDGIRQRAC